MTEQLKFEIANGVARVFLNRPREYNAISAEMFDGLAEWLMEMGGREDVKIIVIRGAGKHFTSGGDIQCVVQALRSPEDQRFERLMGVMDHHYPMMPKLFDVPQPVLISVRGYCLGAAAGFVGLADFAIASETSRFSFPQTRLGSPTIDGVTYPLARSVGLKRAMQLAILGEEFGAAEAKEMGLVTWVVADDKLEEKERDIAERVASAPGLAVRQTKALLRAAFNHSYREQLAAELTAWSVSAQSEDLRAGFRAFEQRQRSAESAQSKAAKDGAR